MSAKISMQMIANRLGVSKYTVSQALSGKPGVSEATRREVTAMARALGYKLKSEPALEIAQKLSFSTGKEGDSAEVHRDKKPYQVLVWMREEHKLEPTFWRRLWLGVENGCSDYGWEPMLLPASFDMRQVIEPTNKVTWAGVIILSRCPTPILLQMQQTGLPMVLVDHEDPLLVADCVLNDNRHAAALACRHVLSQGCRRIVFIGQDSFSISFKERWWGCRQAFDEAAIREEGNTLKKWTIPYSQSSWADQITKRLASMMLEEQPDGFVCANDQIAISLLEVLQKLELKVPEKFHVVGIDNIDDSAHTSPPLSTVELAKELLGYRAVEALNRKCTRPTVHSEKIILSARLIVRSSS
jgi:LacI family transcriptional regulator